MSLSTKVEVMQRLSEKRMSQQEAGKILGVSVRQIKRLLKAYRKKGAAGLVSKHRGCKGNHRLADEVKRKALNVLKTKYTGFGPTLAHEKLVEKEKLKLSDESVRKLTPALPGTVRQDTFAPHASAGGCASGASVIAEGLWKPRKARKVVIHQLRERRACFGELIQIDGSPHDWFEGRAAACVLLVFINDATGQLVQLRFVERESFFSYCQAAEDYFQQHGKPVAFYSDRHGIFRVNVPSTGSGEALTQFGRAMQELDIEILCANSPQAKGRVERVIQTLQDRLPKELRLRGIANWNDGNAYLPEFLHDFNQRFAVEARSSVNAHRPLTAKDDLAHILTWQETRTLSKKPRSSRPKSSTRLARPLACLPNRLPIIPGAEALPRPFPNAEMSHLHPQGTFLFWKTGDILTLG